MIGSQAVNGPRPPRGRDRSARRWGSESLPDDVITGAVTHDCFPVYEIYIDGDKERRRAFVLTHT